MEQVVDKVRRWMSTHELHPLEIDCATAVMLKIIDGKCRMSEYEKQIMICFYDALPHYQGELLGADIHQMIALARESLSDEMREKIYEQRLLAETRIARPRMKSFKARLREDGILEKNL